MSYPQYQQCKREPDPMQAGGVALTPADILGPFYRPGAPFRTDIIPSHREINPNTRLVIRGRVLGVDGQAVGDNAYIEFWQADPDGRYDAAGPDFRGIQPLGADGSYELHTVRPGDYDISDPGAPEPHDFRCAHIHVKVWIDGRDVLTTQLYFADDKYNATDHWFDERRVVNFVERLGHFDFIVKKG